MMAIRRDGQDAYSRRLKAFVAIAGPLARPRLALKASSGSLETRRGAHETLDRGEVEGVEEVADRLALAADGAPEDVPGDVGA